MGVFWSWLWPLLLGGLIGWLIGSWSYRRTGLLAAATKDAEIAGLKAELERFRRRPGLLQAPTEVAPEHGADPRDLVAVVGALESDGAMIAELRRQMQILEEIPPKVIERIVEKPVDNPEHLARIRALENEVASMPQLRAQIMSLQAAQPKENKSSGSDSKTSQEVDRELAEWRTRCGELEQQIRDQARSLAARDQEIRMLRQDPTIDIQAARLAGFNSVKGANDLEIIEGIEPAIAELLRNHGIYSFAELARATPAQIQAMLDRAAPHCRAAHIETWPEQAELAGRNLWRPLKLLQDTLFNERVTPSATA